MINVRMSLSADTMTVYYVDLGAIGGRGKKDQILKIEAEGHVLLQQGDSKGTAESVNYLVAKRTLEMIGNKNNAILQRGEDRVEGKQLQVLLAPDGKIDKVTGGGQVSVRIDPDGKVRSPKESR
ncbi:MAG: LptA/OstA family protein [Magnetococcus sp. DMHC-6]